MPTCIRSSGVALAYMVMHCTLILLVQVTPLALEDISWRYFIIFVVMDALFVVILYIFFPETKGKTLEEMEALFGDKVCRHLTIHVQRIPHVLTTVYVKVAETLEAAGQHDADEKKQMRYHETSIS